MKTWTLVTKHLPSLSSCLHSYSDQSSCSSRCQENCQLTVQPWIEHSANQIDRNDESECNQTTHANETTSLKMKIVVEPFECCVILNMTLCLCVKNLWLGIWVTADNSCRGNFTDTTSNIMIIQTIMLLIIVLSVTYNTYADCRYRNITMHRAVHGMLGYSVQ